LSVRELARGVKRDVKRVHEDIGVLSHLGLLERTDSARDDATPLAMTAPRDDATPS